MLDGTFNLKTSKGNLPLKVTKKAIYNFEKERNASLLSFFLRFKTMPSKNGKDDLDVQYETDIAGLMRFDVQIDLAFYCQDRYSKDELIEIADDASLYSFVSFIVAQYGSQFNIEEMAEIEKGNKNPLPDGSRPTETK
ncbi:MAG: hypothetical protein OEM46_05290 [Ignavibacteria bacterium]|nr:hypothetical protein [Ignavibacteria bacterium]